VIVRTGRARPSRNAFPKNSEIPFAAPIKNCGQFSTPRSLSRNFSHKTNFPKKRPQIGFQQAFLRELHKIRSVGCGLAAHRCN
jgi:hypothetical protein